MRTPSRPLLTTALAAVLILGGAAVNAQQPETLPIDFTEEGEPERWLAVNDGVMGGVSEGGMEIADGVGVFSGRLSLENNGGFSSVWRRPASYRLAGTTGLRLRVRGDGRPYRVRLATPDTREDVNYQAEIETTDGEWTEHELPYSAFVPRYRGRRVEAPPLDPARIRRIGFLLADGQPGPFRLEIDWIGSYSEEGAEGGWAGRRGTGAEPEGAGG